MQTHDPSRNIRVMAEAGYEVAAISDLAETCDLIERLVGPPLAGVDVMRAIQERSKASLFIYREDGRITGVLGELALVESGLEAIKAGAFSGVSPDLDHIARPGDQVAAYYCWGLAAEGRRASMHGVKAVIAARDVLYPELPFFTTAAKPKDAEGDDVASNGARVAFRRFGCTYYPGQPNLLYAPKSLKAGSVAA